MLDTLPVELLYRIIELTPNPASTINELLGVSSELRKKCSTAPIIRLAIPRYFPVCRIPQCRRNGLVRIRTGKRYESYCTVHQHNMEGQRVRITSRFQHQRTLKELIGHNNLRVIILMRKQHRVTLTYSHLYEAILATHLPIVRYILKETNYLKYQLSRILLLCMSGHFLEPCRMLMQKLDVKVNLTDMTETFPYNRYEFRAMQRRSPVQDWTIRAIVFTRFRSLLNEIGHVTEHAFLDLFVLARHQFYVHPSEYELFDDFVDQGATPSTDFIQVLLDQHLDHDFLIHVLQKIATCPGFGDLLPYVAKHAMQTDRVLLLQDFIPFWTATRGPAAISELVDMAILYKSRHCMNYFAMIMPRVYCSNPYILFPYFNINDYTKSELARVITFGIYVPQPHLLFKMVFEGEDEEQKDMLLKGILSSPVYADDFVVSHSTPKAQRQQMVRRLQRIVDPLLI